MKIKSIRKIVNLSMLFLILLTMAISAHAGMTLTKKNIPPDAPAEVREKIEALLSKDDNARRQAAFELGAMNSQASAAVPFLIDMLNDDSILMWDSATKALGQIGEKSAVRPIAAALNRYMEQLNRDYDFEASAGLALEQISRNDVAPLLEAMKEFPHKKIAYVIGRIKNQEATAPLVALLSDKRTDARRSAAMALSMMKYKQSIKPLISALKDSDWQVRMYAAEGLGNINDSASVDALTEALSDIDDDVKNKAAWALRDKADARAMNALIALVKDKKGYNGTRRYAVKALENMTGPKILEAYLPALRDDNDFLRNDVADALYKMEWKPTAISGKVYYIIAKQKWELLLEYKESIEPLIEDLNNKNLTNEIRSQSAFTLGKFVDERSVDALLSALKDDSAIVRRFSAMALAELSVTRTLPALVAALQDKVSFVRKEVADSLKKIGWKPETDEEKALFMIADQTWPEILNIGEPAVKYLVSMQKDGDFYVRKMAAESLQKLGWKPSSESSNIEFLFAINDWDNLIKAGEPALRLLIFELMNIKEQQARYGVAVIIQKFELKPNYFIEYTLSALALEKWDDLIALGQPAKNLLIRLMKDDVNWVRYNSAIALSKFNWKPADKSELISYLIARRDWDELIEIGEPAVKSLTAELGGAYSISVKRALKKITRKQY